MNIHSDDRAQAQEILEAMRQIQDSPELKAEAQTQPERVLNRLGLTGVARHAVALAITAAAVSPLVGQIPSGGAILQGFW